MYHWCRLRLRSRSRLTVSRRDNRIGLRVLLLLRNVIIVLMMIALRGLVGCIRALYFLRLDRCIVGRCVLGMSHLVEGPRLLIVVGRIVSIAGDVVCITALLLVERINVLVRRIVSIAGDVIRITMLLRVERIDVLVRRIVSIAGDVIRITALLLVE